MKNLIAVLSFLIIASCANFENKTDTIMSQTINIPGLGVQLSGNPIWVETTTTTSGMTNHKILLKVTSTDGKVPGGPWVDHIQPVAGAARFDISGLVDYEFDYVFDYLHDSASFDRNLLMSEFSVQVGEYYVDGTGQEVETWGAIETVTVIKGELDKYEIARLESNASSFYDHYISKMRFMSDISYADTEEQKKMTVNSADDPVKAWVMIYSMFPASVRVFIQYTDGSYVVDLFDYWMMQDYMFVELNCEQLITQATGYIDKEIEFYEVSIYTFEDKQTYNILHVDVQNLYSENHEILYCLNNLGAVEAVNCYGEITEKRNIEKNEYTQRQSISPDILESTLKSRRTSRTESFKINTGYKSLDERRWIAGLLEAEMAWLKSERLPSLPGKDYGLVPVIIEPGSFDIDTTSEDLLSIEIELKIAHN
jgi:hypothetical protein